MNSFSPQSDPAAAIVFIGMPGAGKSTMARHLASRLGRNMVDTDQLVMAQQGLSLQEIVDREGFARLREIEAAVIQATDFSGAVVATGGSAVYSAAAMTHLRGFGPLVWLDCPLEALSARLGNFASRGIAGPPGLGLADVYAERLPLYQRWADLVVDARGLDEQALTAAVLAALGMAGDA